MTLDKTEYVQKMESLLCDTETYKILTHNPVNKMITQLKTLLKGWKQRGFIINSVYNKLNSSNPVSLLACGLPKIHKIEYPLCIIVSSIESPLYDLVSFLHNLRK